jgi:two-component system, response regulator RegA
MLDRGNLASAMKCAARDRPDLAIVDMILPDGSGIDLIRELRAADPDIWLILASGYNSVDSTVQAMRAGADDVACKPFTLSVLSSRLRLGVVGFRERPLHLEHKHERENDHLSTHEPEHRLTTIHLITWEHVRRVYEVTERNKSEAARRLGIDRNTLKRWLGMPRPNG